MCGRFAVAILLGLIVAHPVPAVITAKTPLSAIEGAAKYIVVGKVEKYFGDKPAMLVTITEDIKGKAPFRQMPLNCKVADEKAFKDNQIEPLLKRFGPDIEIVFFIAEPPPGSARKNLKTFAYTNGTWFQATGTPTGDKDNVVFVLTSAEPFFRKSFKGTHEELRKLLRDHAAGKAKLPPLDEKEPSGFGPEYKEKGESKKEKVGGRPSHLFLFPFSVSLGSGFAVIPTLGIGAPLAILALLFPTVFGGALVSVTLLFRRLLAFLTLVTVVGVVLGVHGLILWVSPGAFRGSWWGEFSTLWLVMTVVTFACTWWAWRRQINLLYSGEPDAAASTELVILGIMSVGSIITTAVMWWWTGTVNWTDVGWIFTVVMTLGVVAGTLYKLFHVARGAPPFAAAPLSTEGVALSTMLLACLSFAPLFWGGNLNTAGAAEGGGGSKEDDKKAPVVKKWDYSKDVKAMFASSPLVDGDYVYASYSETVTRVATLVKLDRRTGLQKWEFVGKNEDLVEMISTPCIADGKLFFGEGFHDDKNCKVYCVDAELGQEVWRFTTGGQTESSPAVAKGKVYIGAGNDGVYCLDAKTGKQIWKFPAKDYKGRMLRFGGGMNVVGDMLYCASGEDRNEPKDKGETAAFCLDAATGKLLWKSSLPYAAWATPVVRDGKVYQTCGNGDVFSDAAPPDVPGGTLLCLDAKTGKEDWRVKTPNGIIEAPAVDAHRIYFGCRDGQIYCVNRADGRERWRHFLESPIIGTPVLDTDAAGERSFNVFTTAAAGKVCCLNPQNGDIVWTYNLTAQRAYISTSPRLVVTRTKDGATRQLYFGCGLGGGTGDLTANRPVFYCLEDVH